MANDHKPSNKILKETLLELDEPVLFKNVLSNKEFDDWKILDWSIDDLAAKLENQKLPFRVGKNAKTTHPQWEVDTPIEHKTLKEFLTEIKECQNPSKWLYFDYKYMHEWFKDKTNILHSFNWRKFGFELDGSDSTMWIGSKGAHTNCHQDTYGCNLVAQIHGRKLWLLFSPKCSNDMQPTRIPYEESTIYSKYNFFTPTEKEIEVIEKMSGYVKIIVLESKDVLFIPKGWWHYVESLETSLSVNVWLPVKEDSESRLKETLVHLIINTIGEEIPKTINQPESNLLESINLIKASLKECQKLEENLEPVKKKKKLNFTYSDPIPFLKTIFLNIPNLTSENMNLFLEKNNFNESDDLSTELETNEIDGSQLNLLEKVVDAFCHPDVTLKVAQILKSKFIKKYQDRCN